MANPKDYFRTMESDAKQEAAKIEAQLDALLAKEKSAWLAYRKYIVGGAVVGVLIGGLFVHYFL